MIPMDVENSAMLIDIVCMGGADCHGVTMSMALNSPIMVTDSFWDNSILPWFLGPLDLLPWRVVGRSVGRSVCPSVNTSNSATNVWIIFKIGGNIPWVNISRRFFHFLKISIFEFFIIFF